MNLKEIADQMRACGVRSIELFDTIPAPSPEQAWGLIGGVPTDVPPPPEPENKGPGTCIALGCVENNGWSFDTRYCAAHGRFAAGVKP